MWIKYVKLPYVVWDLQYTTHLYACENYLNSNPNIKDDRTNMCHRLICNGPLIITYKEKKDLTIHLIHDPGE